MTMPATVTSNAITLCANSYGKSWTESGFRLPRFMAAYPNAIGARGQDRSGLTLYGLRHTVAILLRELGYDERTSRTP